MNFEELTNSHNVTLTVVTTLPLENVCMENFACLTKNPQLGFLVGKSTHERGPSKLLASV